MALKEPVSIQQAIQAVRKYQQVHGSMNTKLRRDSKSKKETEEEHIFSINKAGLLSYQVQTQILSSMP